MKAIEKFGKYVTYNVDSKNGSWMRVEDGGDAWLYCTDRNMKLPSDSINPTYINRKSMWDLLVHFGCDDESRKEIFNKGLMFSDTIFDNTQVVNQKSTFQYINILAPLNFQTEVTVRIYEKLVELIG